MKCKKCGFDAPIWGWKRLGTQRGLTKGEAKVIVKKMKKTMFKDNAEMIDEFCEKFKMVGIKINGVPPIKEDVQNMLLIPMILGEIHETNFVCPKCSEELQ